MDLKQAKPLEITDKELFEGYFEQYPPEISEYSFTNLYMWRNYYQYQFLEHNDHLILFSRNFLSKHGTPLSEKDGVLFFMPPIGENPEEIILELFRNRKNLEVHRVPESIVTALEKLKEFSELNLQIKEDRDNWDYVYNREELIELPGNKFRNQRRNVQKFEEKYDYKFHLIEDKWLEKCKELQIIWCKIRECQEDEDLEREQEAIFDAFDHYEQLAYNGGLIMIDENPVAYTLGEKLNPETVVIHIEKANINFQGAYQAINNYFCKYCCEKVQFVNREQDLGDLGLKKAKESYNPVKMIKKSIIFQKSP